LVVSTSLNEIEASQKRHVQLKSNYSNIWK